MTVLIVLAVVLANVAFAGLGSVFDYPDILQEPAEEILVEFRADEGAIVALFITLALSGFLCRSTSPAPTSPTSSAMSLWSVWMLAFAILIWRRPDRIEEPVREQPNEALRARPA